MVSKPIADKPIATKPIATKRIATKPIADKPIIDKSDTREVTFSTTGDIVTVKFGCKMTHNGNTHVFVRPSICSNTDDGLYKMLRSEPVQTIKVEDII